jgi:hypothetical protein
MYVNILLSFLQNVVRHQSGKLSIRDNLSKL